MSTKSIDISYQFGYNTVTKSVTCGGDIVKIKAQCIETLLAERGMTKAQLAQSCGMCRQNVSTIIRRGTCEPKTAGKLAAGLGVPVSELIEEART